MKTVWDDPAFAKGWNDTYGIDMAKAPMRAGIVYPLIDTRINWNSDTRIADFGCGNGNLARALLGRPFAEWTGYDSGSAILATAAGLAAADSRLKLKHADIGKPMGDLRGQYDHAVSVFTLEEIAAASAPTFFNNLAAAVSGRQGQVHIFTQHPAYALQQDLLSQERQQPNTKFEGHDGYFDTAPSTYNLSVLNQQNGMASKAEYHHKPMSMIINGLSRADLAVTEMLEVPAGVSNMAQLSAHQPKAGDVPRFLYLKARML